MLVWAVGGIILLVAVTLIFLLARHRQRLPPTPPPTAFTPILKSSDESLYFRLYKLDGNGLIIGQGEHGVDLRIAESTPLVDTVSNRHARIYYEPRYGYVIIEDLDSTNGVFINGRQAPRKNLLKDGWAIGLGGVTLKYHDGEADTSPLD
jgi:hypothetical protein